jgi:hypothetical protein
MDIWANFIQIQIQFRDHMLYAQVLAVSTLCLAWAMKPALLRFKIQFRDFMLYAQVLIVCTLCLA